MAKLKSSSCFRRRIPFLVADWERASEGGRASEGTREGGSEGADDKRDLAAFFSLSGVESHFGTEMRERERKAEGNGGRMRT